MQGRGISHEHGLARCRHAPKCEDLILVCEAVQKRYTHDPEGVTPSELAAVRGVIGWIRRNLPMTAMFPGTRVQASEGNDQHDDEILRRSFSQLSDDAVTPGTAAFDEDQRRLCRRCLMHRCSKDDCKKPRTKDCVCRGDLTIACDHCRPRCKKGFDSNEPCTCAQCRLSQHSNGPCASCRRKDNNARIPGREDCSFAACGCEEWVYFNVDGNRVEFHVPRNEAALHVRVPLLVGAWRANMDIRLCLDIHAVKTYIMK